MYTRHPDGVPWAWGASAVRPELRVAVQGQPSAPRGGIKSDEDVWAGLVGRHGDLVQIEVQLQQGHARELLVQTTFRFRT